MAIAFQTVTASARAIPVQLSNTHATRPVSILDLLIVFLPS